MNFVQMLDAAGIVLLVGQAGWIGLLYRRMGSLRGALDSAGEVIEQLDAASQRLDASAGGIARKVRDGVAEVDAKLTSCRKVAQELTVASRNAEEIATRLDQAVRQTKRVTAARAAALPREEVEPLGFARRLAGEPAARPEAAGRLLAHDLALAPTLSLRAADLMETDARHTLKLEVG
ncbi:hypothetical protein [Paracraurococcus ruber]|uniref:Uncharacterized protein n=1 Tax=Paracraurococcus ruber TaxID=77675 RepID=A0ABS1CZR2_9PROT|nr:hypothetical protein [Paracraurococcus ruber]MBK1660029.1 hypothetical protein [Paracraurococcus ruber]TDG28626.1 hypothetical protein E2C05_20230 [Paracraurococcus ruber]